jgi:hypothetical protein
MAHCGYEASAVEDMLAKPWKGLILGIKGIKTEGDFVTQAAPKYNSLANIAVKVE